MSTRRETLTDDGLGHVLGHWLAEGPTAPPETTAESAMRTVVTIPQRRWRGRILRTTGSFGLPAQVGLAVAGIGAAVVVAIGVSLNSGPPPGVVPSPSAGPTATEGAVGGTRTFEDAGFSVEIQPDWSVNEVEPGSIEIADSLSGARMFITVGAPDGTLKSCRVRFFPCLDLGVMSLADFERSFLAAFRLRSQPATVAGEEALEFTHQGMVFPTVRHWFVLQGGRPYLIQYQEQRNRPADTVPPMAAALLNSWNWLELESSTPSADGSRGLGLFREPEFEVLIPRGWDEIQTAGSALPGVVAFGHDYDEMSLLTISAGRADGAFDLCDFQCASANASTLGGIQETLPLPDTIMVWTGYGEESEEVPLSTVVEATTLGGAPGRIVHQEDPDGELFAHLYAFAIVNERPVVFTFMPTPSWGMAGYPVTEYIDAGQRQAILDSFRFLD
jgi:hypothetical protein